MAAPVLYNEGGMELLWDTVEVFAYAGWMLTLAFPLFVIAFIVLRRRYRKKLPSHRTMVIFILVAICGGFCIFRDHIALITIGYFDVWDYARIKLQPEGPKLRPQHDVKFNLGQIHATQVIYHAKYNTYTEITDVADIDDIMASDQLRSGSWVAEYRGNIYSYYCSDIFFPADFSLKKDLLIYNPETNWPDVIFKPEVSRNSFTCMAIGDIDNDDALDVWSINDVGSVDHIIEDAGDDGTRTLGEITFKGRVYLRAYDGGIYFYVLGMLTPFLLLSIVLDIAMALRLRRED